MKDVPEQSTADIYYNGQTDAGRKRISCRVTGVISLTLSRTCAMQTAVQLHARLHFTLLPSPFPAEQLGLTYRLTFCSAQLHRLSRDCRQTKQATS